MRLLQFVKTKMSGVGFQPGATDWKANRQTIHHTRDFDSQLDIVLEYTHDIHVGAVLVDLYAECLAFRTASVSFFIIR